MNPSIKYSPKKNDKRKIEGVAIILKEFLNLLDKYGIEHDSEKIMSPVQNSTFSVPRQDTNLSADNMAMMFDVGHVSAFQKETFQRE